MSPGRGGGAETRSRPAPLRGYVTRENLFRWLTPPANFLRPSGATTSHRDFLLQRAGALVSLHLEPCDVGLILRKAACADFLDHRVGHFLQRRVARMMRLLVGVVAPRVVTANH